jgi:hypothetical protein
MFGIKKFLNLKSHYFQQIVENNNMVNSILWNFVSKHEIQDTSNTNWNMSHL